MNIKFLLAALTAFLLMGVYGLSAQTSVYAKAVTATNKLRVGSDAGRYLTSITHTINGSSTNQQLPTAEAVYEYGQTLPDDWGNQAVEHGSGLTGDGTPSDPMDWTGCIVDAPLMGSGTDLSHLTLLNSSIDSGYIKQFGVSMRDINPEGAASGNVIAWTGNMWKPTAPSGGTNIYNSNGVVTASTARDVEVPATSSLNIHSTDDLTYFNFSNGTISAGAPYAELVTDEAIISATGSLDLRSGINNGIGIDQVAGNSIYFEDPFIIRDTRATPRGLEYDRNIHATYNPYSHADKSYVDSVAAIAGTGDVTLSGENYLSIAGQAITANAVNLSGTNVTGTLAAGRFGTLTGDVTTPGGSYATTIADNSVDGTDIALGSDAQGDVMYYNGTDWVRLAAGTSGHFLKTNGAGANPAWASASGGSDALGTGFTSGGGSGTIPAFTDARALGPFRILYSGSTAAIDIDDNESGDRMRLNSGNGNGEVFVSNSTVHLSADAGTTTLLVQSGNVTHNAKATVAQAAAFSGDISPTQITSNQNNYNPTNLSTSSTLRLSSDAARDITGLQGGADGRLMYVLNVGGSNITLKTESGSSTDINRFLFVADIVLQPNQGCTLQYDSTSLRWRCVGLGG